MDQTKMKKDVYVIDVVHILKVLWRRAWLLVLCALICAGVGFSYAKFFVTPQYSSSIMLYINNSSFSFGNSSFSISSAQIDAAKKLVDTYSVILKNRTTLEKVIDETKVPYTYQQMTRMISTFPVDDTEVLGVTVTTDNPYMSARIANAIAEVLPLRVSDIVEGSSVKVVDNAVVDTNKVSPSITKYTAVGFVLGFLICAAVLTVLALLDGTVHDEEFIRQVYDYPVLAKIPDFNDTMSARKRYGAYYKHKAKERR